MSHTKAKSIASILDYCRTAHFFVGHQLYIFVALNLLSVVVESFGILLFIPFLSALELGVGESEGVFGPIRQFFSRIGLELDLSLTLLLLVLAFAVKGILVFAISAYRQYVCAMRAFEIREHLVDTFGGLKYRQSTSQGSGFVAHLVTTEVNGAIMTIASLSRALSAALTTLVFFLAIIFLHPQLFVVAAAAALAHLLLLRGMSSRAQQLSASATQESARLHTLLLELLHAVKYLKATSQFFAITRVIRSSNRRAASIELKQSLMNAAYSAIKEPLLVLLLSGVIYMHVVVQAQSISLLLVPLLFLYRCMQEAGFLQGNWQTVCETSGSFFNVHRTLRLFREQQEEHDEKRPYRFEDGIEFRNVSFSYDNAPLFRNLNLSIPKNSSLALVGASGAGKTTLIDLLTTILPPSSGEVLLDGVPLHSISLSEFRKKIGYVVQDAVIFSDTIANNISLQLDCSLSQETLTRVHEASKLAHVDEFVSQMPEGYLTQVGERGFRLSGGQKQRLAIARELFKNPDILILDESTSALDPRSEHFIQQSISRLRGSMTVLIISHRLSSVSYVDRILVLEQGRILEDGSFSELVARENSHFRSLYNLQRAV